MSHNYNQIETLIYELELQLLEPDTRTSVIELNRLLSDDFIEFGSSGTIYSKGDIIDRLPQEEAPTFEVSELSIKSLSDDVILATYKVAINSKMSLRSSIWKRNDAQWQMVFHQGTSTTV